MHAIFYLAPFWLATVAINTFHWRFRRSERWLTPVHSKPMLVVFAVWFVTIFALMILRWQNILPDAPYICAVVGFLIVGQLESIWVRHQWRKHLRDSAEAPSITDVLARSPTRAFDRWSAEKFLGKPSAPLNPGWAPFQSDEVRTILAHATPEELRQFQIESMIQATAAGANLGEMIGIALGGALIFAFFFVGIMLPFWITLCLEIIGVSYVVWKQQPKLNAIRQKFARMLCATEWARSQGFTSDGLRLQKWPWQR